MEFQISSLYQVTNKNLIGIKKSKKIGRNRTKFVSKMSHN